MTISVYNAGVILSMFMIFRISQFICTLDSNKLRNRNKLRVSSSELLDLWKGVAIKMPYEPSNSPVSQTFVSNCLAHVIHRDGNVLADYRRLLDYIGVSIDTDKSVIIMLHFGYVPASRNVKQEEAEYDRAAKRFYDIVQEQFGQHIMCDAVFLGNYLYVHIFNPRDDSDTKYPNSLTPKYSDLVEICKRIIRISAEELGVAVKAVVGRNVQRTITDSARLLIEFLRFQNFLESDLNIFVEPDNSLGMKHLPIFEDSRIFPLINYLKSSQEDTQQKIIAFVDELIKYVLDKQPRTMAEFQVVFSSFFALVIDSFKKENLPMAAFSCFDLAKLMSVTDTVTVFKEELITELAAFMERYSNNGSQSIGEIVSYVREQIEQRFTDSQLSVSELAEEVGISQPYLSSQFIQRNGISPLAFIHRCRINYAKELMEATDMSLQEISERVGYGHAATMYRSFKKYEKTTPGMYRSRLTQPDENDLN